MQQGIKQRWSGFREYESPHHGIDRYFRNQTHAVAVVYSTGTHDGWLHLSIRRNDRKAECDWRIFQRIKNEIAGQDREAVQLFPAMNRLLDSANQYSLWVAPKGYTIGVGQIDHEVSESSFCGSVQRPFADDDPIRETMREIPASAPRNYFPLPTHPTSLFEYLASEEFNALSMEERRGYLAQYLPHAKETVG